VKVIVIGAGPAGLTFAYHALLKGYDVKIYEARNKLAFKPCGEALHGEALEFLPFNINGNHKWILSRFSLVKVYYEGVYMRTINSPFKDKGLIINKSMFLQDLADFITKLGGKIELGKTFKYGEEDSDYIIDSSGYLTASRYINKELYSSYKLIPVMRDYAEANGIIDNDTLLFDLLDRGYFWIFPYGKDMYNIGVGGFYNGEELKKILEKKIESYELKVYKSKRQGASVAVGGVLKNRAFKNIRIIGEAAGFVMPTTGEGIRFSIYSAMEFFNFSNLIKKIEKRINSNAKLLSRLISLDSKLKMNLLMKSNEKLIEAFLGERDFTFMDYLATASLVAQTKFNSI